jgi:hypothetical protein
MLVAAARPGTQRNVVLFCQRGITSICADFLVELRGLEPLTSAVQAPACFTAPPLPILQGLLSKARRWIPP